MVPFEEESRGGDVAVGEDFRWRLSVEGFEVVDAQYGVTLGVSGVGVRCFYRLLLLPVFCTQLTDLLLTTDTEKCY